MLRQRIWCFYSATLISGLSPFCLLNHVVSGHLDRTSPDVSCDDALVVLYTTCCELVKQGFLLYSHDWASALSIVCTRFYAWLVFLCLGFHSSILIVFSPYTEDYLRSQHLVVNHTVCSTHCLCVTNHIPASGDDEVYHMPVLRATMRPGGLEFIPLFEHD